MARTLKPPGYELLFEAITSGASVWIEENALDDFPGGVVAQGTLVPAGHPILKAHPDWFRPARADTRKGSWPGRLAR